MLRPNNPRLDMRRLGTRIRQRSESCTAVPVWPGETAWADSLRGRTVTLGASRMPRGHAAVDYADLMALPDADFVHAAYYHLQGRLPESAELNRRQQQLMEGVAREQLLLELYRSGSDTVPPRALPGLARGLARARLVYYPRLGRGVRWLLGALRLDRLSQQIDHGRSVQDARYQALLDILREQAARIETMEAQQRRFQADVGILKQQLDRLLSTASPGTPPTHAAPAPSADPLPAAAVKPPQQNAAGEDFYRALEARFRGAPAAITALMREHLPRVHAAPGIAHGLPLLDLGCGRGEWLGLLRDEGIMAQGVDLNAANIEACREQGLVARYQDALAALGERDDASLGMITAFHLVEHLPHELLRQLLHEAFRTLAPGGRLLLETPNPQNLLVGSCTFYLDPTHVRPLPPDFMVFLAEFTGFENVCAIPLHPVGQEHHLQDTSETAQRLNHYLHGPQDYALLATRPADEEHNA